MTLDAQTVEVWFNFFDVLEAATLGVSAQTAAPTVRQVVDVIPDELVRRVLVAATLEAVWAMPPAETRPRTGAEIRARTTQIRSWVKRQRLEVSWSAS